MALLAFAVPSLNLADVREGEGADGGDGVGGGAEPEEPLEELLDRLLEERHSEGDLEIVHQSHFRSQFALQHFN